MRPRKPRTRAAILENQTAWEGMLGLIPLPREDAQFTSTSQSSMGQELVDPRPMKIIKGKELPLGPEEEWKHPSEPHCNSFGHLIRYFSSGRGMNNKTTPKAIVYVEIKWHNQDRKSPCL